jgi:3-oxoadipate enol-lactonase
MPRFELPGASLYYQEYGDGPCVVFLHGSGGNHLSWWQQIPTLSQRFRCLVPDLRSYGLSRAAVPPHDPNVFCDDLRLILDHLSIARVHVVGQSIGGHYALCFALAHPQRIHGLVLADTLAGIADLRVAEAKAAAGAIPEDLFERALGPTFRAQQQSLTALYRMIEGLNRADREPQTLVPADVDVNALADFKISTLFLVGEADPVAPPTAVSIAAGLVPGAKFKMISGSGHSVYFEQPDAFNRALLEFFASL